MDATASHLEAPIASLKASGAAVLALFVAPDEATQFPAYAIRLGWRPLIVVNPPWTRVERKVEDPVSIASSRVPRTSTSRDDSGDQALPHDHLEV